MIKKLKDTLYVWGYVSFVVVGVLALFSVIRGILLYILWNSILINWLGLNLPHMSFVIAMVAGLVTGLLFGGSSNSNRS